jgi:agmatine/peptidylarginine deiminase
METQYRLPAEWEPQDAIQLTWPNAATDWQPYLKDIVSTYIELVKGHHKIRARCRRMPADAVGTRSVLQSHLSQPAFVPCERLSVQTSTTRGHVITDRSRLIASDTTAKRNKILDFKFNGWGEKFRWEDDNTITRQLYDSGLSLTVTGTPIPTLSWRAAL